MNAWGYFFMLLGVSFTTGEIFRIIDRIERPARRRRRAAAQ